MRKRCEKAEDLHGYNVAALNRKLINVFHDTYLASYSVSVSLIT